MDRELRDAIAYFYEAGMIDNLSRDEAYYVEVLLECAADKLGIILD